MRNGYGLGSSLAIKWALGGKWRGVYTIAPLSDFRPPDASKDAKEKMYDLPGRKGKQIRIFNLPDVYEYQDRPRTFPLADAYREAKTKVKFIHYVGEGDPEVQDEFEDKEDYAKKPADAEMQEYEQKDHVQDLDGKPIGQLLDEAMKEASTTFEPTLEDQPKADDKPPEKEEVGKKKIVAEGPLSFLLKPPAPNQGGKRKDEYMMIEGILIRIHRTP